MAKARFSYTKMRLPPGSKIKRPYPTMNFATIRNSLLLENNNTEKIEKNGNIFTTEEKSYANKSLKIKILINIFNKD